MISHHICDRHVDVSLQLPVVELCPLDDDEVCWEVDPPSNSGCGDHDLDLHTDVQLLHGATIPLNQTLI